MGREAVLHIFSALIVSAIAIGMTNAIASEGIVSLTNEELHEVRQQEQQSNRYVDQLIDSSVAEDLPPDQLRNAEQLKAQEEGYLRTFHFGTDMRHIKSEQQTESRLLLDLLSYQQTLNFGDLSVLLNAGWYEADFAENGDEEATELDGYHFIFQQQAFAVSDDWTMDNTLGVNKVFQNSLVSKSSQLNLNSRHFQGIASRLYSDETELRFMFGERGELTENADFETNGVDVTGLGVAHHFDKNWTAGTQLWHLDDEENPDYQQEWTAFVRYRDDDDQKTVKMQVLGADDSHGYWLDAEYRKDRFTHQAGFYHLDDDLHWMGEGLTDGRDGAFWRFSYSHPKYHARTALDWQDSDQSQRLSLRQGINYHLDQQTTVGGDLSYSQTSYADTPQDQHRSHAVVFASRRYSDGQNHRLELSVEDRQGSNGNDTDDSREYGLDYSHQWLLAGSDELGLQLAANRTESQFGDNNSVQGGINWRRNLENGNHWGTNLNLHRVFGDGEDSTAAHYRLFASRQLNKHWQLDGSIEHDRDLDDDDWHSSFQISLNYQHTKGQPVNRGQRRSGTLKGVVFYDENGDGIRQPLEETAQGVTVTLDQTGLPQTTDQNGEFEFSSLPSGAYKIAVAEETVPLPWEWTERMARTVEIRLRSTEFIDLPLVRVNPED